MDGLQTSPFKQRRGCRGQDSVRRSKNKRFHEELEAKRKAMFGEGYIPREYVPTYQQHPPPSFPLSFKSSDERRQETIDPEKVQSEEDPKLIREPTVTLVRQFESNTSFWTELKEQSRQYFDGLTFVEASRLEQQRLRDYLERTAARMNSQDQVIVGESAFDLPLDTTPLPERTISVCGTFMIDENNNNESLDIDDSGIVCHVGRKPVQSETVSLVSTNSSNTKQHVVSIPAVDSVLPIPPVAIKSSVSTPPHNIFSRRSSFRSVGHLKVVFVDDQQYTFSTATKNILSMIRQSRRMYRQYKNSQSEVCQITEASLEVLRCRKCNGKGIIGFASPEWEAYD